MTEPRWAGRRPRILVTNDDGVTAPGIRVLERIAAEVGEAVYTVAPELNHSGAGHSLTLRRPLRVHEVGENRWCVDGTPTDCVMLGLQHVLEKERIDLVLSGINHGANLADDVTYSGTVAAAMEATLLRVPAIALSQVCEDQASLRWDTAERLGAEIVRRCLGFAWPGDVLLNVNLPDRAPDDVRGIRITRQGKRKFGDELVERLDPRGEPYVWIGGLTKGDEIPPEDTDLHAVASGFASVTPIHMDMTHRPSQKALEAIFRG
ncbi:MAG: 5'/3'-nucleotidase SurE [Geminicoccaceae bacterium]|nr:5'/3'-nucleotidase SurE [Geminicoccaceae bacterium]